MPQGERTEQEQIEFLAMLKEINLLFLASSVLIIMDRTYMSRFWTQYEAWLSMMQVSDEGLVAADAATSRATIITIHGAPQYLVDALKQEWSDCTPALAHEKLSQPDISVTNQKDKVRTPP